MKWKTSDFDYNLPEELIAQTPLLDRSSSRMLVIHNTEKKYEDKHFYDIVDYLHAGDVLDLPLLHLFTPCICFSRLRECHFIGSFYTIIYINTLILISAIITNIKEINPIATNRAFHWIIAFFFSGNIIVIVYQTSPPALSYNRSLHSHT